VIQLTGSELLDALRSPFAAEQLGCPSGEPVVVRLGGGTRPGPLPDIDHLIDAMASLPCVVIGIGDLTHPLRALVDVHAPDEAGLAPIVDGVCAHPQAAVALVVLLRGSERRTIGQGLVAESAAYSTLQAGPEFAAWRAAHAVRAPRPDDGPAVRVERDGEDVLIALSRPHVHNAFSAQMRDELLDALAAASAASGGRVLLVGDGPSFCSGGDLDEFGSRPDPATGHLVRLARSAGRAIAAISDRVTARLHGACLGAGIELPAFASRVVARPGTVIGLPEIELGLIPGAGGTVSLPRRIGRHRTAHLALTAERIDAATALEWGLVDEIVD